MKYFIDFLLVLGLLNQCTSATKKVDQQEFLQSHARITAKIVLNLRQNHDVKSKVLDTIPENYIIFAEERTKEKEKIANHEDYWYKTKFKNKTGWLFGKYLDFEEKEVSLSKLIQGTSNAPQHPTNYKKLSQYFDANIIQKDYKQVISEFGKPTSEIKFQGSNPHGGYNNYLELLYPDFRLKFIDEFLFDVTYFTSEKLKNKTIQIGSDLHDLELEFEIPYYISKDQFSYLTCFPYSDECPVGYPNTIGFKLEKQKVKSVRLTLYLD